MINAAEKIQTYFAKDSCSKKLRLGDLIVFQSTIHEIKNSGNPYEYDYKTSPDDITVGTSPSLPPEYHPMVVFGMLIDEEIIKKSEKARSNMQDNAIQYQHYMKNLKLRDARFKLV